MVVSRYFAFPDPVDEHAARTVAALVAGTAVVAIVTQAWWLTVPLAVGFLLRVATGPRVSPFALVATKVVAPRFARPKHVPGPPKRFAQGIGAVVTGAGAIAALVGANEVAAVALGVIVVAATLEAALGFCLGCWMFARGIDLGLVPESVCERCAVSYDG